MIEIIIFELNYFKRCVFFGFFLLMAYDVFRVLRRLIRHSDFIVTIEDIVYGIFIGIQIFLHNYENNNGVVRFFMFLGLIIGSIIYHKIFSTTLVEVFSKSIQFLVDKIYKMLIIFRNVSKNVNKIWKSSKKIRKN